jgi:hypothetical protein
MKLVNSALALIAGFLAIAALSGVVDMALRGTGVFPHSPAAYARWMLVLALLYRTGFAVVGGVIVAKIATRNSMKHVVMLAALGTFIGVAGVVSGWKLVGYPHWYAIALAVSTFPAIWSGGKLAVGAKNSA